jgi:hypothetical protein
MGKRTSVYLQNQKKHECEVPVLWNQQVKTDRTFRNYKPDVTNRDYEKGNYLLVDVAVSGDKK